MFFFEFGYIQLCGINNSNITIVVVCRLPDRDLSLFNKNYFKFVNKMATEKQKCYLTDDYNINLFHYD